MSAAIGKGLALILFYFNVHAADLNPDKYEMRFDENSLERVVRLFPYVYQAEWNTNVPPEKILGVVYTETNATIQIKGDQGRSFGLGQIWCTRHFNWIGEFDNPSVQSCSDYFDPNQNIFTIANILTHVKNRYDISWRESLEVYHGGSYTGKDWPYKNKVKYFGNVFGEYYKTWKQLKGYPDVQENRGRPKRKKLQARR